MSDEYGGDVLYTVAEVAKLLKLNPQTVRRYCRDGELASVKVGKGWRVPASSLSKLLDERPAKEGELDSGFQRIRIS